MAFFELNSDIAIGDFRFSGANEVHIKRSVHGITDTAIIKLPSIGKIVTNGKSNPETVINGTQFNDGDPVVIKLGYNGDMQMEFKGFVRRRNLNMPLEIECEGYSWLLRRTTITVFNKLTTVKDLLTLAVSGINSNYQISVQCDVDIELTNVAIDNKSGFEIINDIGKYTDNCLTCFFIQPDVLWCGFMYTPYASGTDVFNLDTINYKLGYNVIKENSLKERGSNNNPTQVTYEKRLSTGDKISATSSVIKNTVGTRNKVLNHLKEPDGLQQLADEKAYQLNYSGYEGCINGFLQPYATPGYKVNIIDDRYKERNGIYIIESTEIAYGITGARRIVEVGPKVGFAKSQ